MAGFSVLSIVNTSLNKSMTWWMHNLILSHRMRKPDFCLCYNKDTDQLYSNCTSDQRFCFATIPLLLSSEISSLQLSSVTVQASLCWTLSGTQIVGFLTHRLILILTETSAACLCPVQKQNED